MYLSSIRKELGKSVFSNNGMNVRQLYHAHSSRKFCSMCRETNVFLLWKCHDDLCISLVRPQTFGLLARQSKKAI